MSITQCVKDITPELAAKYLEKNHSNRPIRKAHVRMFVRMMLDGDFHLTHQGLAFSDEGVLLDGQHRLLAIIQSGETVSMTITEGLPASAYKDMDCGVGRSLSDRVLFDESHEKNSKISGVCLALLNMVTLGKGQKTLTRTHAAEAVQRVYEQYRDSINAIVRDVFYRIPVEQKQTFSRNRNVQAALVLFHSKHPTEALEVATRLFNGLGEPTDPIRMTYNYLSAHHSCSSLEMLQRVYWGINKDRAKATAKHSGKARAPWFLKDSVPSENYNIEDPVTGDIVTITGIPPVAQPVSATEQK